MEFSIFKSFASVYSSQVDSVRTHGNARLVFFLQLGYQHDSSILIGWLQATLPEKNLIDRIGNFWFLKLPFHNTVSLDVKCKINSTPRRILLFESIP